MNFGIEQEFPILYKYIKLRHATSTLQDGKFRIGTLREYQGYDHAEIGDKEEGIQGIELPAYAADRAACMQNLIAKYPLLDALHSDQRFTDIQNEDILAKVLIVAPDCYMFCMTSEYSPAVMQQFGCDACIEITSPLNFFKALSVAMGSRAHFAALHVCKYLTSRHLPWEEHVTYRIQAIKTLDQKHQKEVRFTWDPIYTSGFDASNTVLEPIFLKCKEATQYCRLYTP
jgi:hypothetical protein